MGRPVLGLASKASEAEPKLGAFGEASGAAVRAEGASAEWVTVRAASVVGVRHRLAGQPNEDYFAWSMGDGVIALAVADGLGSLGGSAQAAVRACRAAVGAATADGVSDPAEATRLGVQAANAASPGGGATTLVIAVVCRDGRVEICRVGDSTAFVVGAGRAAELFAPRDDESVGSSTSALPTDPTAWGNTGDAEFWERSACQLSQEEVLALATDGIADPWRDGPQTVGPAMVQVVTAFPSPLELAAAVDFSRQGCHDDRTMLCAWLRPG